MTKTDVKLFNEKIKSLIQLEKGKQYLMVFDRKSGVNTARLELFANKLSKEFSIKICGLIIDDIDSMRVVALEEEKA